MSKAGNSVLPEPRRIGNRYELQAVLGRGGMACVYRATDLALGREIALKELQLPESVRDRESVTALFEREFHTLSQLAHPRVIAVYDYGVTTHGPYYTMELLDGGDLRERAPVPWREACELLFDVCSSLALLHSRRLLHRDISPRNIRCTRDGKAKLIDFGAMAPMGAGGAQVVGTPAYTPPETVHRLATDARTDLFSLGATLYTSLTGSLPYPARSFAEAVAAWRSKPAPPSARVPSIPPALDDLVLSLISIEPELRPQSAFDVMQRLAAIADLTRDESADVSAAYLATPTLVGRDGSLEFVREHVRSALNGHGGSVLIRSAPGLGRSRLLDACVLDAKTLGAFVLRATASGASEPFSVARALIEQILPATPHAGLLEAYPEVFAPAAEDTLAPRVELKPLAAQGADAERVQQALLRFLLTVSRGQPLLIAVDDVQRSDAASAALLAALIDKRRRGNLAVLLTAEHGDEPDMITDLLARRCTPLDLQPLSAANVQALLSSVFGDVANLDMLASEIQDVALGNPRTCMDLAQHLVDKQVIRYASGTWTLPASLAAADLPRSSQDALRAKLTRLSQAARAMAEAHALAYTELLSADDYRALRLAPDDRSTDHAVHELLALGVITSAGNDYAIGNRLWTAALRAGISADDARARHRALAEMYRPKARLAMIYHLFEAGAELEGVDALAEQHRSYQQHGFDYKLIDHNLCKLAPSYQRAIRAALTAQRPRRELNDLRRWAVALSVTAWDEGYAETAPDWFEQLRHDSGLDLWEADTAPGTEGERLTRALSGAYQRHMATPEAERVYSVEEAIRLLAEYVVLSIANGARQRNIRLLARLPKIMQPFAPLGPILDAIWNNAVATAEMECELRMEAAHARWCDVLKKLDALQRDEVAHLDMIRNAVAYAVGLIEAQLGMPTATGYAARLEQDPMHKLSALNLRKIVRLEAGDWAGAEKLRRESEVLALQLGSVQMFNALVMVEFNVYTLARDLTGMQRAIEQLRHMAARTPGWQINLLNAQAQFDLVRGDYAAALRGFEQCIEQTEFGPDGLSRSLLDRMLAQVGMCETLLALGRVEESRARAQATAEFCVQRNMGVLNSEVVRALALAEAKLGQHTTANARLRDVVAKQLAAGISGPRLGVNYEALARIAIWADDEPSFEEYSRLTANEYRRGAHSPLAARYERLINEGLRAGFQPTVELGDFQPSASMLEGSTTDAPDVQTTVLRAMTGAARSHERAKRALRLLCEARAASGGHLYLIGQELPVLVASCGSVGDPGNLADHVREFLYQEQSRAETMTEIVTGTLLGEAEAAHSSARIGSTDYELLLLSCVVDGEGVVAGVAAVAKGERRVHYIKQSQLLNTLASHLLSAGDTRGARFDLG
ncbi:MAG TPA: protein kinase [Polyangiales bacterium]|nr:protein kinase [Polyangiales bacterium]